jgi:hypothetical protein
VTGDDLLRPTMTHRRCADAREPETERAPWCAGSAAGVAVGVAVASGEADVTLRTTATARPALFFRCAGGRWPAASPAPTHLRTDLLLLPGAAWTRNPRFEFSATLTRPARHVRAPAMCAARGPPSTTGQSDSDQRLRGAVLSPSPGRSVGPMRPRPGATVPSTRRVPRVPSPLCTRCAS